MFVSVDIQQCPVNLCPPIFLSCPVCWLLMQLVCQYFGQKPPPLCLHWHQAERGLDPVAMDSRAKENHQDSQPAHHHVGQFTTCASTKRFLCIPQGVQNPFCSYPPCLLSRAGTKLDPRLKKCIISRFLFTNATEIIPDYLSSWRSPETALALCSG